MAISRPDDAKIQAHLLVVEQALKGAHGSVITASEVRDEEIRVTIKPDAAAAVMGFLRDDKDCRFDYISCLCGVDYSDHVTIVYHLFSTKTRCKINVNAPLPNDSLTIASVTKVWAGADWLERETAEMFGVVFEGHPDPRKLLLTDDNDEAPLRKEYRLNYGEK